MDGYKLIGLALFFITFLVLSYILWHTHRMKKGLQDEEIKRAARIIRLRNVALILGMFAISTFFMLLSSIPMLSPDTPEYEARDNLSTYALYAGLALLMTAACLAVISRLPQFNFSRLVRLHAVKEKLRATFKFKPRTKSKRTTRV